MVLNRVFKGEKMSITQYKILSADTTGKKVIDQADTFSGDPDIGKAMFDAIPDVIIEKLNDLIDALATSPQSLTCTVDAATANKGTYTGTFLKQGLIYINFENGNTSGSPTIVLDGETYAISGLPTVAKISTSTYQTYLLKKTTESTLTFVSNPDYVVEHGTTGGFLYKRFADGTCYAWGSPSVDLESSGSFGSGGLYLHNGTFVIPTGLFNDRPNLFANHPAASGVYGSAMGYTTSATQGGVQIIKNNSTSTTVSQSVFAIGNWR